MNQSQYTTILERKLREKQNKLEDKVKKTKRYQNLVKMSDTAYKNYREFEEKKKDLLPKPVWEDIRKISDEFKKEWDEMSLIIDTKKRKEAKVKLLKKYELYK